MRFFHVEIWESHCSQKYERRWIRQQTLCWNTFEQRVEKLLKTEYISERMITMMLKVNQRKIVLTSVYLPHTGYADHQAEKMQKCIETQVKHRKKSKQSLREISTQD